MSSCNSIFTYINVLNLISVDHPYFTRILPFDVDWFLEIMRYKTVDFLVGGSGGGNGAAGGQGSYQDYVGPPPDQGSIYEPIVFGGNGGDGAGSSSNLRCTYAHVQTGGKGGIYVQHLDYLVICNFFFSDILCVHFMWLM